MAAINLGQRRTLPVPLPVATINWWVVSAIVLFGIGAMLPVLQNSAATSQGFNVQRVQAEQTQLKGEIQLLEADVAQLSSLGRVERRAQEIGMVPGDRPIYVQVAEPGPEPAKLPAEYLPGPVRTPDEPEPWWQSLFSWVSFGN